MVLSNIASQGRNEGGPQPGVSRARTEDFSSRAAAALSPHTPKSIDRCKYDQVWTSQHTVITVPAMLDTGCDPNLIREDVAHEAGLCVESYIGPSLSQAGGSHFTPIGQATTRIHFCGGKRTFKLDFLLAPADADYDILLGNAFIKMAGLLEWKPTAFVLRFPRETPGKFPSNNYCRRANPSTQNKQRNVGADS